MSRFSPAGPFRVRFAPSPTGFLHLGGLRTALFNYLISRKFPGSRFILRIEDTDQSRVVPDAVEQLISTLTWTGLSFDEGPGKESVHGPFVQSQRLPLYKDHVEDLLETGAAYRCFCSRQRLETLRSTMPYGHYDRFCRRIPLQESKFRLSCGESHTVRFKVPDGAFDESVLHQDLVYGRILSGLSKVDDAILMKSDGFPTYHFANVVDDHLMKVNLVIRGQEWIASTPLHILLYKAFNWDLPLFAHLPLLVNSSGAKLSKRQGDAHVAHYIEAGYLPEALINFVAYLGWAPSRELRSEVMTLDELAQNFSLAELNTADATVNLQKLNWLNRQHMQQRLRNEYLVGDLLAAVKAQVRGITNDSYEDEYLKKVMSLMSERINVPCDLAKLAPYFFHDPVYSSQECTEMWKKVQSKQNRDGIINFLSQFEHDPISAIDANKSMGMLSRVILTGLSIGPSIRDVASILGPDVCKRRVGLFRDAFNLR